MQCTIATKGLFEKPVQTLREGLNGIDEHTRPLNAHHRMPYHELAGHPLPCTTVSADCESSLRVLRAGATHFPLLKRLVGLLYEAIRQHRLLGSIDTALCAGDFEKLTNYVASQTTTKYARVIVGLMWKMVTVSPSDCNNVIYLT